MRAQMAARLMLQLLREFRAGNAVRIFAQGGKDFCVGGHASKSRPMSTARAECVSAPTEIKSTPVWAMARTVFRFTPPLASVLRAAVDDFHRRRNCFRAHVIEQNDVRAGIQRPARLVQACRLRLRFSVWEIFCARGQRRRRWHSAFHFATRRDDCP